MSDLVVRLRGYAQSINNAIAGGREVCAGNADIQLLREAASRIEALEKAAESFVREAKAMAVSLGEQEAIAIDGISHVLTKHRDEWRALVGAFPSGSLFRELGAMS